MDGGGRRESSLAARRRGRGIDFGNSDADTDEDEGYITRSEPSRAERDPDPKRSREETDPSLRKEPDGGVCNVAVRGDEFLFSSVRTCKASGRGHKTDLLLMLRLGVEGDSSCWRRGQTILNV